MLVMGLLDSVKSLLDKWNGKRKRADDEENATCKRKRVDSYTLTPASKFQRSEINEIRSCKSYYRYNEEITSSETRTVEFKQGGVLFNNDTFIQLIRKYGPAFLNCEGGVLLAGVTDSGIVKGLSIYSSQKEKFSYLMNVEINKFRPTVSRDLWSISYVPVSDCSKFSRGDKVVVEISFKKGKSDEIYENSVHDVYLRRDGGVQGPLRPLDIKNLVISKYNDTLKSRKNKQCMPSVAEEPIKDNPITEERKRKERLEKKGIKYIVID